MEEEVRGREEGGGRRERACKLSMRDFLYAGSSLPFKITFLILW